MLKGGIVSKVGIEICDVDDDGFPGRMGGKSGPRRGTSLTPWCRLRGASLPRLPEREGLCFLNLRGADPSIAVGDGEASFAGEADVMVVAQVKASRPLLS